MRIFMSTPSGKEALPAFQDLVREHQSMVWSLARHCLRDPALAEDVAQEAFLRLHRHLDRLESPGHVLHWLRQVTVRLCIDALRRRPPLHVPFETAGEPAVEPTLGDPLVAARLRDLVADLPADARIAVVLRFQEDLEPAEIAGLLGQSVHTVKSRIQRALAQLRARWPEGARP